MPQADATPMPASAGTQTPERTSQGSSGRFNRIIQDQGLLLVILLFGLVLFLFSADFLTRANIVNLLYQATILGVFAIGMTFVILTAGIDLSVGANAGLTSVLSMAAVVKWGLPPFFAVVVGIGVGLLIGTINGLLVTRLGISALIATLATLSACTGAAFAYSNGANITPVPSFLT